MRVLPAYEGALGQVDLVPILVHDVGDFVERWSRETGSRTLPSFKERWPASLQSDLGDGSPTID